MGNPQKFRNPETLDWRVFNLSELLTLQGINQHSQIRALDKTLAEEINNSGIV
jgi:hypothetical protein